MGQIQDDANQAFRDYITDGDAGSGAHEPLKSDIRAVFALVDALVGDAGVRFTFDTSTTTSADPGAGDIRLNNASFASVTEVGMSDSSAASGNPDVSAYLATFDDSTSTIKGHLLIRKVGAPQNFAIYAVTAAVDATTHWRFTVTHVQSAGSFAAGDRLAALFVSKGDKGDAGASGTPFELIVAVSDETTALTTGTAKITFRMPVAVTLTGVRASLTTAQASGNILTVDINEGGASILSTKLTIDNTEKTSTTAAAPAVISDSALADDAEMRVDIDQVGDGTAAGLKITLIGTRT